MTKCELTELNGNYFYKSYDFFDEETKNLLLTDCEYFLNFPLFTQEGILPQSTFNILNVVSDPTGFNNLHWIEFLNKSELYVNKYLKESNQDNSQLKLRSCFISKVKEYSRKSAYGRLFYDDEKKILTINQYHHDGDSIILVYYIKNLRRHGTLVVSGGEPVILNGEENSISIFAGELYHSAIFPPCEISTEYPRYIIGLSFHK